MKKYALLIFGILLSSAAIGGGYRIGSDTGTAPRRPWWYRTTYAGVADGVESPTGEVSCLAATWWIVDGSMEFSIPSEDSWRPTAAGTKLLSASRAGEYLWWLDNEGGGYIPSLQIDSATIGSVGILEATDLIAVRATIADATLTNATATNLYIVDSDHSIQKSSTNLLLNVTGGAIKFSVDDVDEVTITGNYLRPSANGGNSLGAPTHDWNALYTRYFVAASGGLYATGALSVDGNVSATGTLYSSDGAFDRPDAGAMTIGSADVTSITLQTDSTGDGELVLPGGSVSKSEINANIAGDGLTGGAGSALAVNPGTGLEISSDTVRIAAAAAGNGLTGGGGSALAVGGSSTITVSADSIAVANDSINAAKLADTLDLDAALAINDYDVSIEEALEVGEATPVGAAASDLVAGWHLDEAAGTLDNFEGTAGYDMESVNTPTYDVAAVFDSGLTFASASSEYASVSSALGLTGWPVTVTAWFKTSTYGTAMSIFTLNDVSEANITYSLQVRSTGAVMALRRNTTAYYTHGGSYVADGQWHHAVMVIAGNADCKIYVDGVLEGAGTDSVTWAAGIDTAAIGVNLDSAPDSYFNGTIDEVAVYDAALTAAQIKELYANGMATKIEDGAVSTQIVDASTVKAISVIATDDIVQKYGTGKTYGVPISRDSVGYPHPAHYFGTCADGSVTYTSDGWPEAFASGCTPVVTITVLHNATTPPFTWRLRTSTNTGFTYYILLLDDTDVTSSYTVHWMADGWLD